MVITLSSLVMFVFYMLVAAVVIGLLFWLIGYLE